MKHFDALLDHSDPLVAETAMLLQDFTQQFENDEMSEAEYKELACDLLDMQRIDEMSLDLAHKTKIAKAFQQLMDIVKVVGKFI